MLSLDTRKTTRDLLALAQLEGITPDLVLLDGHHDWLTDPHRVGLLGLLGCLLRLARQLLGLLHVLQLLEVDVLA